MAKRHQKLPIACNQGDQIRLFKNRPKCSQNGFLTKLFQNFYGGKKKLKKFVYFCNLKKNYPKKTLTQ
jgi:hypothetical protein